MFIGATLPTDNEAGFVTATNVTVSLTAVRAVANSAGEFFIWFDSLFGVLALMITCLFVN
jgi:hypothetical protein